MILAYLELNLGNTFSVIRHFRVVNEALALVTAWRQVPGQRVLKAFNDRRLSASVLAHDQRQRRIKNNSYKKSQAINELTVS